MKSGGGLGCGGALGLLAIFCAILYLLATGGQGVPLTGLLEGGDLDAQRASYQSTARAAETEAARIADWQSRLAQTQQAATAAAIQSIQDAQARQTAQAQAATEAVQIQQTQSAWQVTVEAGRAQATAAASQTAIVVNGKATADALVLAQAAEQSTQTAVAGRIQLQRDQTAADVGYQLRYWPAFVAAFLGAALAIGGWKWLRIKEDTAATIVPRYPDGSSASAIARGKLMVPDRSKSSILDPRQPVLPADEAQLDVTRAEQAVQFMRGLARSGSRSLARGANGQPGFPGGGPVVEEILPEEAPWNMLQSWNGKGFPLGLGAGSTRIALDPEKTPNLMVAGTSGIGKTMMSLRVITAEALASGWQVLLANDAGGDFAPLAGHPNLVRVGRTPGEIADALDALRAEVQRRKDILEATQISTYYRLTNAQTAIGPRLMLVLDELVALVQEAKTEGLNNRIWRPMISITSQCRKTGIMVVLGTTNPTERSLGEDGLTVRDNCGRLLFRVYDRAVSQAVLNIKDAINLGESQFLAQLDTPEPVKGVAFHPQDHELRDFLAARQVPVLPQPPFLMLPPSVSTAADSDPEIVELAGKIREVWLAQGSKRAMARAAGIVYEGNYCKKIDRAIEYLEKRANANDGSAPSSDPVSGVSS